MGRQKKRRTSVPWQGSFCFEGLQAFGQKNAKIVASLSSKKLPSALYDKDPEDSDPEDSFLEDDGAHSSTK